MQYRRIRGSAEAPVGPAVLLGAGIGLALGFLLGELYAGEGGRGAVRRIAPWFRRRSPPNPAELTPDLQRVLDRLLGPDAESLELVPVGRHAIELHGWVTSRQARARAIRTTRAALDPEVKLVDRLLVWGEDDGPIPELPPSGKADIA